MTAILDHKPWDLSHVLDLVNSLSVAESTSQHNPSEQDAHYFESRLREPEEDKAGIERRDFATQSHSLGDFSKIFHFLGAPVSSPTPAPAVQRPQSFEIEQPIFTTKTDYTSDGAAYSKARSAAAGNTQKHSEDGTEEQTTDAVSDSSIVPDSPTLTKSQRKKRNRRARRAQEAALAEERAAKKTQASVSESEADIVSRKAPAKKASVHAVTTTPNRVYDLRPRDTSGKAITVESPDPLLEAAKVAAQKLDLAKKANENAVSAQKVASSSKQPKPSVHGPLPKPSHTTSRTLGVVNIPGSDALRSRPVQSWPPSTPQNNQVTKFIPSTVGAVSATTLAPSQLVTASKQNTVPPKPAHTIQPLIVRTGEDRHWALLMKLIGDFYGDSKHLLSPMNLTTHNNDPKGIHVFVDASNIFIGFNDQLKRSRGIPPWTQVPPVDLSFDALALLMERRRPVAKRVLVGSTPYLPAFDKAKAVGYETSILEKVYKARELTERQVYFKEHDRNGFRKPQRAKAPPANNVATLNGAAGSGSGSGSGSETNAPQYAPARMIEQGVDELLHLKILESVVDADAPGTMVLATGDAAQAEYSEGFMAMAERALKKGWAVELVSWSKNISAMYTRREWTRAWGQRFRIITLDDYSEELLDM